MPATYDSAPRILADWSPCRAERSPHRGTHEQLRRHRLGRRLAGRALRRRVGRRWTAGRRRRTPAGRRRVLLLGVHPFQDAAAPRGGGPGGARGGGQRPGRCRGGPGIPRFHGLELLRCRPGALAGGQGYRPAARHWPAGRGGRGRSGRCAPYRRAHCRGDRLGSGRATGPGPGRLGGCLDQPRGDRHEGRATAPADTGWWAGRRRDGPGRAPPGRRGGPGRSGRACARP